METIKWWNTISHERGEMPAGEKQATIRYFRMNAIRRIKKHPNDTPVVYAADMQDGSLRLYDTPLSKKEIERAQTNPAFVKIYFVERRKP